MSKDFNNLDDLSNYVLSVAENGLKNEVLENVVKKEEKKKIQEEVYDAYRIDSNGKKHNPYIYKRRKNHGGLIADKNIIGKVNNISNNEIELEVTNITKGNGNLKGRKIAELIEYGDGYNGMEYNYKTNKDNTSYQFLQARPFTQATIEELENSKEYEKELKRALESRGIEIE